MLSAPEFAASAAWTVATDTSRLVMLAATRTSASAWRTATDPLTAPVRLIVYPPGCRPLPLDPGCDAAAASAFDKPARVASGSISKYRAIVPDSTAPNRPTHGPTSINSARWPPCLFHALSTSGGTHGKRIGRSERRCRFNSQDADVIVLDGPHDEPAGSVVDVDRSCPRRWGRHELGRSNSVLLRELVEEPQHGRDTVTDLLLVAVRARTQRFPPFGGFMLERERQDVCSFPLDGSPAGFYTLTLLPYYPSGPNGIYPIALL